MIYILLLCQKCGCSSIGRAFRCQRKGCRFKSDHPLQNLIPSIQQSQSSLNAYSELKKALTETEFNVSLAMKSLGYTTDGGSARQRFQKVLNSYKR